MYSDVAAAGPEPWSRHVRRAGVRVPLGMGLDVLSWALAIDLYFARDVRAYGRTHMSFLEELKRRNVIRVASAYGVMSWLVIQVIETLFPVYGISDAVIKLIVACLVIGFIPVVLLSWVFEFTADGLQLDKDVDRSSRPVQASTKKLDRALIVLMTVAIAYFALDKFVFKPGRDQQQLQDATQAARIAALAEQVDLEQPQALPHSVAVLPFDNLSPDPDDAYFAYGVHESVINDLAKIQAMTVIARSSVVRYSDTDLSIKEIADDLNVGAVMGGSVRYAGERVRISAQLIDPQTGVQMWADQYDRDLTDVFEVQSDIAQRIARALEAELLPREQERFTNVPTSSAEASVAFFQAMAMIRSGFRVAASPSIRSALQGHLDRAIEEDPDFALAHAWKARIYVASRLYDPVATSDWADFKAQTEALVEHHSARAISLDPNLGLAYSTLADLRAHNWQAEAAQEAATQAMGLSPNDPEVLVRQAGFETHRDRSEQAISAMLRAIELDPNSGRVLHELGYALHASGQHQRANQILERCLELNPREAICSVMLARSQFALGNEQEALDALELTERLIPDDAAPGIRGDIAWGYGLLERPADARRAFDRVIELQATRYVDPAVLAWSYMGIQDYDEAYRQLELAANDLSLIQDSYPAHFIRENSWSDPRLEQSDFLALRQRFRLE